MNAFLLGISISGGCIAHCGSLMLPILFCEKERRIHLTALFLLSRLLGYLLFAILSYLVGQIIIHQGLLDNLLLKGLLTFAIGIILLRYAWGQKSNLSCGSNCSKNTRSKSFSKFRKGAYSYAVQVGFLTGLSICTPFLAIIAEGIGQETILSTIFTFLLFYLGTCVILLPIMLAGALKPHPIVRQIGGISGFLLAGIYLFKGLIWSIAAIYIYV